MPTRAVASKFKVELAIFGVRFCNQKRLTGQLGSTHGKFSTDWRAARSDFASMPLEKRVMVVHTTKPFAFRQNAQYLTNRMFISVKLFEPPCPFLRRIEIQSNIRLDASSAIKN